MTDDKLIKTPAEIAAETAPSRLLGVGRGRAPQMVVETVVEAGRTAGNEAQAGFAAAEELAAESAAAGAGAAAAASESVAELLTEYHQQTLQRTTEAMRAMWQCRTLSDVLSLQLRFVGDSWSDGLDKAVRLSALSLKQAQDGLGALGRS